ncbi:MAG: dethiobiotin synthase [Marmoricola sp.]
MTVTFVTGTDTDVGKTITTAALVVQAKSLGRSPYVIKPAQTGVKHEAGDLTTVRHLAGGVPGHVGIALSEPLAPVAAAALDSVALPALEDQLRILEHNASWYDATHVEGAGGLLVELGDGFGLLELADAAVAAGIEVEFVVVARSGLGTLNHSMLTVNAIRARGHAVRGIVIGSMPSEPDLATRGNVTELPRLTGVPTLAAIPAGAGALSPADFQAQAPSWFA